MARIKSTDRIERIFRGERPAKPAPLDLNSEKSRAEWRRYMADCAEADNPRLRPPDGMLN